MAVARIGVIGRIEALAVISDGSLKVTVKERFSYFMPTQENNQKETASFVPWRISFATITVFIFALQFPVWWFFDFVFSQTNSIAGTRIIAQVLVGGLSIEILFITFLHERFFKKRLDTKRSFMERITSYLDVLAELFAVFFASLLFASILTYSYLAITGRINTTVPNGDMLNMVGAIIAIIGVVGVGIYKVIDKSITDKYEKSFTEIQKKIDTKAENERAESRKEYGELRGDLITRATSERSATRAEGLTGVSFVFEEFIEVLDELRAVCDMVKSVCGNCKQNKDGEICAEHKVVENRVIGMQDAYIKGAIQYDERAYDLVKDINKEEYSDVIVRAINCLVFHETVYYKKNNCAEFKTLKESLQVQQTPTEPKHSSGIQQPQILVLRDKLSNLLETKEVQNNKNLTKQNLLVYKETALGVSYFLEVNDDEEEKEKIRNQLRINKENVSERIYSRWVKIYDL